MSSFLDSKERIMEVILTQKGRQKLAQGKLNIKYYAFHDDEIDYQAQYQIMPDDFRPVNLVAPVISGVTDLFTVITATDGTWTNNPTFTYQWYSNDVAIPSATGSSYFVEIPYNGTSIYLIVTATNNNVSNTAQSNTL